MNALPICWPLLSNSRILKKRNLSGPQRHVPPALHRLLASAPAATCLLLHQVHQSPFSKSSLLHSIWDLETPAVAQVSRAGCPRFLPNLVLGWKSVCLSLSSSFPAGAIIASQPRVGTSTHSHHAQQDRIQQYSKKNQSWKTWTRKEREKCGGGVPSASRHSP